ncbi:hypothetical protein JXJ21_24225 [candidate division KSB1 bacterium]|nr:hypothetical protein [candidate division KSB1 bacterium]
MAESGEVDGVRYEFIHDDSCFSFRGSFVIDAELDCMIHILYDFKHLKKLISGADSIVLIQQGNDWYDVCYVYEKLFFTNRSIYRKTLKIEEQKVVFKMISNRQNTSLFPNVLSSSGYYQIKCESTGYAIEYFQECKITFSILKDFYIKKAKKESTKFMLELKKYVERICH